MNPRLIAACVAAAFAAGCASWGGDFAIDEFVRIQITGGDRTMCLARSYQMETRRARRGRDFAAARLFADRGWAALADAPPAPDALQGEYGVEAARLSRGRAALAAATAGADETTACACATAQGAFDGWADSADQSRLANRLPRLLKRPGDPADRVAARAAFFGAWLKLCRGLRIPAG